MKGIQARNFLMVFVLALLLPLESHAYSHFINTNSKGEWSIAFWSKASFPITFSIDKEPVSIEGKDPQVIAEGVVNLWNTVSGTYARLKLEKLNIDIHSKNFKKEIKVGDGRFEVIVEQDGNLLESLGLDSKFIAGIGIPITSNNKEGNPRQPIYGQIVDAFLIVNTEQAWSIRRFQRLLAHELGHTLGLAHSNIAHLSDPDEAPLMFYDPTQASSRIKLHPDDKAGLASLYPNDSFETQYGAIRGRVVGRDNRPVMGVAVIASPVDSKNQSIGSWTDKAGDFYLTALPPAEYKLHVRPIDGSSVVNDMDVTLHVGGVYQQGNKTFCPESYNDHPFRLCRYPPSQYETLLVKSGETLVVGVIQEGSENPSPPMTCEFGSLPSHPNHPRSNPPNVPQKGKRGGVCAVSLPEKTAEPSPDEPVFVDKTVDAGRKDNPPEREKKRTPTACGCNQGGQSFSLLWIFIGILLIRLRNILHFRTKSRLERTNKRQ